LANHATFFADDLASDAQNKRRVVGRVRFITYVMGRRSEVRIMATQQRHPIKSVSRCVEVLEFFAQEKGAVTVGEVARRLHMPQSSTSMLLSSLVTLGYLQHDPGKRAFQATVRVMLLGSFAKDDVAVLGSLVTGMEEMRHQTRGSVILAMRQGINVRYIVVLRGDNSVAESFVTGATRSAFQVAPGKILLAEETDGQIGRLLRRSNAEQPDQSRQIAIAKALEEIAQIRRNRWARSPGGATPTTDLTSILMPPRLEGQPQLSLTLGLPTGEAQAQRQKIVDSLRALAERVYG
jgi:DNA-binding IclR family transcriptional regulator